MTYKAIFLLTVLSVTSFAGTYQGKGRVIDAVTKEPIYGATVFIKEDKATLTTDKNGTFSFETKRNKVTVIAQLPGYKKFSQTISQPFPELLIQLDLSTNFTIGRVYVKEKNRVEGTKQKIKIEQIKKSTAQLFSDSLKIIQTMPGVITGNDFSSLMYVRGGEFYETACYLDNIFILNPYMWGGTESIFNPAFVDKIDFHSGGFPVKYFQSLSGVIDVKNIEGDYEKRNGYLDISATTFEVFAQGPMVKDKSSYVYGFRRTYYDLLANIALGDKYKGIVFPYFYDSQMKFTWKLHGQDKLYLDILGSYEGMDFDSTALKTADNPDMKIFKFYYNDGRLLPAMNYEKYFDEDLSMLTTLSLRYEEGTYEYTDDDNYFLSRNRQYDSFLRSRVTSVLNRQTVEYGAYIFRTTIDSDLTSRFRTKMPDGTYYNDSKDLNYDLTSITVGGAYLQDDIELSKDKLFMNIGGLGEYLDSTHDQTFCPRGGIKYLLTETSSIKFNTGLYSQFSAYGSDGPPPIIQNNHIKSEKAIHYILGYEQDLPSDFFIRLETYIKDYYDRVVADPDPNLDYTNQGIRRAEGVDFFLQKKIGSKWDGWLAYSYLFARDKILQRNDPTLYAGKSTLDYPEPVGDWYRFSKERSHNMSLVLNYDISKKWKIATTYKYSTGTPYTKVIGATYNATTGAYVPIYGKYLDDTLPDYSRLDVKLTMPFHSWFGFGREIENVEFYIQIINVLDTVNVDRYYYSTDYTKQHTAQMLPRMPIVGFKYNF